LDDKGVKRNDTQVVPYGAKQKYFVGSHLRVRPKQSLPLGKGGGPLAVEGLWKQTRRECKIEKSTTNQQKMVKTLGKGGKCILFESNLTKRTKKGRFFLCIGRRKFLF